MNSKELVERVDGLNSVSTLKNWLSLIKEISGHEFAKSEDRRFMYRETYDFTADDLADFRFLADLKQEHGLRKAIELVFGSLREQEEENTTKEFKSVYEALRTAESNILILDRRTIKHSSEIEELKRDLTDLTNRFEELYETLSNGMAGKMLGLAKKKSGK